MGKNVDTGYAGSMTEIKLMNYGRGAGKTHTLTKWATESRQRLYVAPGQTTDYTSILRRISNNHFTQVAFDGFDLADPQHLLTLQLVVNTPSVVSVILATTHEAMLTEASQALNEKFKLQGGVINGEAWRKNNGYSDREVFEKAEADEKARITEEAGSLIVDGAIQKEQLEPIQKVKARDLRIGDHLPGLGIVVSLSGSRKARKPFIISFEKGHATQLTRGTVTTQAHTLLDVDITKRQ